MWKHIQPTSTNLPCGLTILLFVPFKDRTAGASRGTSPACFYIYFADLHGDAKSGGHSGEATPVPIPNTEVKLTCADGTATVGE